MKNRMHLSSGTLLQGGKYRIIRTLGQGGFGITYEAEQVLLRRKVALKEFFMRDCCERDGETCHVTVGIGSQRNLVEKFRGKFIREAQMIAGMDHPNIIRVLDVFEENGTAYYVMDYLSGGSLADKVKKDGPLTEAKAEEYIRQVADALSYIHSRNTVHLDVKPSNILLNAKGEAVLIDFGISKHYDDSGEQTSSTPVGISKGYAPLEQGRDGDVSQFKPSTDIYALGATLYYLVSGIVPPEASIVNEDGLERLDGISDRIWEAINQAMQPKRKDRPQEILSFLSLLDEKCAPLSEETVLVKVAKPSMPEGKAGVQPMPESEFKPEPKSAITDSSVEKKNDLLSALVAVALVAFIILGVVLGGKDGHRGETQDQTEKITVAIETDDANISGNNPTPITEQVVFGSAKIASSPSGAAIWLDGKNTGKITPEILEELTPGKHNIKIVLDGYEDYTGIITITSGKRTDLSKTLIARQGQNSQSAALASETPKDDSAKTSGTINGHEWVDLGLSVKWATCNVGASSPSDYGSYFAWGETRPKSDYSWSTLKYCSDDSGDSFTKYNTKSKYGPVDNKTRLDPSDDAARANWGGSWRMPTDTEFTELRTNCIWTMTTQNGKKGYKVTSKKNGNSIFLPAAGVWSGASLREVDLVHGYYWSSTLSTSYSSGACGLLFFTNNVYASIGDRYDGRPVRPVTE